MFANKTQNFIDWTQIITKKTKKKQKLDTVLCKQSFGSILCDYTFFYISKRRLIKRQVKYGRAWNACVHKIQSSLVSSVWQSKPNKVVLLDAQCWQYVLSKVTKQIVMPLLSLAIYNLCLRPKIVLLWRTEKLPQRTVPCGWMTHIYISLFLCAKYLQTGAG